MPKDKPVDWAAIERDFCDGPMSIREMARWYGLDDKSIRKKAKAEGWTRQVRKGLAQENSERRLPRAATPVVEPEASTDLSERGREIAARLMGELESITAHAGELEDMICTEESDPRRRQALLKALSLSERSTTLRNISSAIKTLNEAVAPEGKKAQRQGQAEKAASGGRFGVPSGPKMVVDNTR